MILYGTNSSDVLNGTIGNDTISGLAGDDIIYGGDGDDLIDGGTGNDTLYGGNGNDTLRVGNGNDTLYGEAGNDYLDGSPTSDVTLFGGVDNDTYVVDTTGDTVMEYVDEGIDTVKSSINYTLGDNLENLILTVAPNGTGNDLDNTITSYGIANVLDGGTGNDIMYAGGNNDTLDGGTGNDIMYGEDGNDTMYGEDGNDTLTGGNWSDTLTGGNGTDTFVFDSKMGADTVTDFVSGTDTLQFRDGNTVLNIDDNDHNIDGAVSLAGPGGFAPSAELVIVTQNIAGTITATSAAAAIGSADATYGVGNIRLFAVDNDMNSALYLFTSADTDAAVEYNELLLLGTLQGAASTVLSDYAFFA